MNAEMAQALREPFPDAEVGKLPRVTCKACRDRNCQQHQARRCAECGNYITTAHIHLDYVGHAEVTDRLLAVDPMWTWEPMSKDASGNPVADRYGGIWIWLTVCGVTRPAYGHPDGKTGGDAVKESIGDALRNGAMRYGVALDLWRRSEAEHAEHFTDTARASQLRTEVAELAESKGYQLSTVDADFTKVMGRDIRQAGAAELAEYRDRLAGYPNAD